MAETPEPHVLIIGAGITGLLIAHGLQQAGIKYTVFEAEDAGRWRPKEWTMGIHWGLPLLESLLPPHLAGRIVMDGSVDGSLNYEQPPNNGALIFDGPSGEILKDLTVSGHIVRVSRRRLRALCSEGIAVKNNHTLDTVTTNDQDGMVIATFRNGQSYTGTLVVGCDGPRSVVRTNLFASTPDVAEAKAVEGVAGFSIAISYPAETAKFIRSRSHPVWCMCISPDMFPFMSMQEVPDPEKPETWRFFIFISWLGEKRENLSNDERMADVKERGAKLAEPFRTAILSIPDDTQLLYTDVAYWIAEPWNTRDGRITLAGDSAHPMPPYRGQGGNHAIQDAHNFVEAVKKIAEATQGRAELQASLMKEYSDEVAKRGAEETALSKKNGMMLMAYDEFKDSPYAKQGLTRGGSQ